MNPRVQRVHGIGSPKRSRCAAPRRQRVTSAQRVRAHRQVARIYTTDGASTKRLPVASEDDAPATDEAEDYIEE